MPSAPNLASWNDLFLETPTLKLSPNVTDFMRCIVVQLLSQMHFRYTRGCWHKVHSSMAAGDYLKSLQGPSISCSCMRYCLWRITFRRRNRFHCLSWGLFWCLVFKETAVVLLLSNPFTLAFGCVLRILYKLVVLLPRKVYLSTLCSLFYTSWNHYRSRPHDSLSTTGQQTKVHCTGALYWLTIHSNLLFQECIHNVIWFDQLQSHVFNVCRKCP